MWKTLVHKELREISLVAAVALTLYLLLAVSAMGVKAPLLRAVPIAPPVLWAEDSGAIPFVSSTFEYFFAYLSAAFAILLGFRQTVGEAVQGTYQFLLHLPTSRRRVLGCKLLVGTAVYLVVAALPIAGYALWAAAPGTHASPFYWSMTLPVWQIWWSMTVLYLAAFLSGLRPGRWFGSRLLPLVAAVPPAVLAAVLAQRLAWGQLALSLLVTFVTGVVLLAATASVLRTRDFS